MYNLLYKCIEADVVENHLPQFAANSRKYIYMYCPPIVQNPEANANAFAMNVFFPVLIFKYVPEHCESHEI